MRRIISLCLTRWGELFHLGKSVSSKEIKQKALHCGYVACGIIPSTAFSEYKQYLDERVNTFPGSKNFYENMYGMVNPDDNAKSIIVCTQRYNRYKVPASLEGMIGKFYMFDGRVPYSQEFRAKTEFETWLKLNGINILKCGIPARWAAAKAGLGKFGRNNFIYSPEHGSYIWIESWAVDVELECDALQNEIYLSNCNDNCEKCIKACPTKALSGKLSMDMGKCITRLVCSAKDIPNEEIRPLMGSWIYGCDMCQSACPLNKGKFAETEEFPLLSEFEEYLKPENILEMDDDTYQNIVNPRFWYSGKEGVWRWKCNALRCMINSGDKKYLGLVKKYCDHEDERIREIAQWGCRILQE